MNIRKIVPIFFTSLVIVLFSLIVGYYFMPQFSYKANPTSVLNGKTEALSKVRSMSEVIKYEVDLKMAGSEASFEVQDDGAQWLIQVFEIVKNIEEPSHTATFGWYGVDKITGKVNKEL